MIKKGEKFAWGMGFRFVMVDIPEGALVHKDDLAGLTGVATRERPFRSKGSIGEQLYAHMTHFGKPEGYEHVLYPEGHPESIVPRTPVLYESEQGDIYVGFVEEVSE